MELLGTYSTARINTDSYNLTYTFPDNCNAILTHKDGVYTVAIKLKKGQIQPSTNYITDNVICNQYNGMIEIEFLQQNFNEIGGDWGDGTSTKPKVKIYVNA